MKTITVPQRFTYTSLPWFKRPYDKGSTERYILDFRQCTYIDSSALGMMLMMRSALKSKVTIKNVPNNVMAILKVANFQLLFRNEEP